MNKLFLLIDPPDSLVFEYAPKVTVSSSLRLRNISRQSVAFKVKTNAIKSYRVRPSQGILAPDQESELSIIMHPLDEHPGEVKHKFLVQAMPTDLVEASQEEINEEFSKIDKDSFQNSRLDVVIVDKLEGQPIEGAKGAFSEDKNEDLKAQIQELQELIKKHSDENVSLQQRLENIQLETKKEEMAARSTSNEAINGFSLMHLSLLFLLGFFVGYWIKF